MHKLYLSLIKLSLINLTYKIANYFKTLLPACLFFIPLLTAANTIIQNCAAPGKSYFTHLDYGLYWYGYHNHCEKFIAGQSNVFFNPTKPTVIYVHGWEPGTTQRLHRGSFAAIYINGPDVDLAKAWLKKGWNIGIFYWNQFADEPNVEDAEAKIWTVQGPNGMRWRNADGNFYESNLNQNVSQLFYDTYIQAFNHYQGGEIRLVGHSLGAQLVVATAMLINQHIVTGDIPSQLLPTRIALLDPAFFENRSKFLDNQSSAQIISNDIDSLKKQGVIFESYRTSLIGNIPLLDNDTAILDKTAFTELKPQYYSTYDLLDKHTDAVWWYFWSYAFPPPPLANSPVKAICASSPDKQVQQMMNSAKECVQIQGNRDKNIAADVMVEKDKD